MFASHSYDSRPQTSFPMKTYTDPTIHPSAPEPRPSYWQKFGAGSLTISVILHVILLIVGLIYVFQIIPSPEKKPDEWATRGSSGSSGSEANTTRKRTQMSRANLPRIAALEKESTIVLPEPQVSTSMPVMTSLNDGGSLGGPGSLTTGNGSLGRDKIGPGPGVIGANSNKSFIFLPEIIRKRCSKQDRLARLKQNGGTEACEDTVLNGLRWLKANQNPDGSWGKDTPAAMTGLALLAYFGHCETPSSEEFGESCGRGIVWLVSLGMKNDGKMSGNFTANHWSYEHAIATYALGEATTFCKNSVNEVPYLTEVTQKAGQYIIDHQNKNGGWAYAYATEGGHTDLSVAGWQIQALRACDHSGLPFKGMNSCINKALDYVNGRQSPEGGFGYVGPGKPPSGYYTLTGVGMLCNQMWNKGNRPEVRKGASYVLENTKFDYNTEFCDLYGHYYESQAMMQRGGNDWKQYNELFRDQILQNQDADGSWKTPGGGKKARAAGGTWQGDKLYRTCLCTLMMEVYYRFLGSGGDVLRPGI